MDNDKDKDARDKDKKGARPADSPVHSAEMEELYRRLQPEMRRPKPNPDAIAAALEAAQRLAAEADAEQAVDDSEEELASDSASTVCGVCGYRNREGNKFCGMCGIAVTEAAPGNPGMPQDGMSQAGMPAAGLPEEGEDLSAHVLALPPNPFLEDDSEPEERPARTRPTGNETHHYHHHYHHHYFPGGEAMPARSAPDVFRADAARDEKMRPTAAHRGDMSRAEAAVRRVTQEWVLACNTKHLDDLLDLYVPDALVLRSNCPPVRGAAAVREFFFGALDSGLGEVEIDPLRVEVVGDFAYEAGRCKALIPSATGKRREERGKYLWVCARQNNGEWKLAADCWSSDLTLSNLESEVPLSTGVRTALPRKGL